MVCLNCGKTIDDDLKVCPFCGSLVESSYDASPYYETDAAQEPPVELANEIPDADAAQDFYDDDPVYGDNRSRGRGRPMLAGGAFSLATFLSLVSCVLCLVCLLSISSLKRSLGDLSGSLSGSVGELRSAVYSLDDRLGQLDSTLAGVQSEAYNQLASQSIAITKDITPLTGPVEANKYNVMFIINAKGNLSMNTSFDWQKYNEATGGWVSIVFTGNATTNEQYGLRLENTFDRGENVYTSKLWANGITSEASGTYRCVITDATGITKTSAEATVSVS